MIRQCVALRPGRSLSTATILLASQFVVPPVLAQVDPSIVVTARRVEERLDDTPLSVAALDAQALERTNIETVAELAREIPNFSTTPNGVLGVETPSIRGIFSAAGSATVGLYLDDVPLQVRALGFSRNIDLRTFDVERVEVMRGPQGTLFGANSMGGTVRFVTRQPDLTTSEARAGAEIAFTRFGGVSHELRGAIGAPLLPGRIGFRAAVYRRSDAGYVDRIDRTTGRWQARNVDDLSVLAIRAGLRFAIGERAELTPALSWQRGRRDDYSFFDSTLGPYRQANILPQPAEDEFILPSLTARFEVGGATLTSVSSWLDRDDSQSTDYSRVFGELVLGGAVPGLVPDGGTLSQTQVSQRNFTQEMRLASRTEAALRWVAGLFYRRSRLDLEQAVIEPGVAALVEEFLGGSVEEVFGVPLLPGGVTYRGFERLSERQIAVFGEAAWHPVPGLEVSAGARLSRSRLDLEVLSEGPYAGGSFTGPARQRQSETPFTPRLGVSYRPAPGRLFYASVGKGFRIGGANPPVPTAACAEDLAAFGRSEAPTGYNSDTLWSYEAGAKIASAEGRVRFGVAVFRIDWNGIQQPVTLPNCGFSFVDNLGSARNQGFEADVDARLFPGLLVSGSIGLVDARFRDDVGAGSDAEGVPRLVAAAGDRVPYVARWSGRLAAEYRFAVEASGHAYLRAGYQFTGPYRRSPSPTAVSYDPRVYRGAGFDNVALRIGYETDDWRIAAFVDNLLDDRSILFSSAELVPATGAPLRQMTIRPRTVGLGGALQF